MFPLIALKPDRPALTVIVIQQLKVIEVEHDYRSAALLRKLIDQIGLHIYKRAAIIQVCR